MIGRKLLLCINRISKIGSGRETFTIFAIVDVHVYHEKGDRTKLTRVN